jgi:hypothetical protein
LKAVCQQTAFFPDFFFPATRQSTKYDLMNEKIPLTVNPSFGTLTGAKSGNFGT